MKKLALALGVGLIFVGCNQEFNSRLNISQELKVRTKPGQEEFLNIGSGNYAMKISTGSISATVSLIDSSGKEIKFKTKTLQSIAQQMNSLESMNLTLSGAQIGQTFDVNLIKKKSLVNTSSEVTKTESCVSGYHTEYFTRCNPPESICAVYKETCTQKKKTNGDERSDFKCRNVCVRYVTRPGNCYQVPRQVAEYGQRTIRGRTKSFKTVTNLRFVQGGLEKANVPAIVQPSQYFDETFSGDCR